jgi:ATP adenylyltransferase
MPYLSGQEPLPEGCIFCIKPQEQDEEVHILWRGEFCYVILNRYPYSNGHLMIVPFAHVPSPVEMDAATLAEWMALTQLSLRVLREAYDPQGFNAGINMGTAAGAGVEGHVHLHIVPRWAGDTNYMTTTGQTRVIPEWLDETYTRLRPLFEELAAED